MGIAVGGGVAPIYMALTWKKASAVGAITGCCSGLCFGLLAWLVTCQGYYGKITIDNLGGDYPMLAGAPPAVLRPCSTGRRRRRRWGPQRGGPGRALPPPPAHGPPLPGSLRWRTASAAPAGPPPDNVQATWPPSWAPSSSAPPSRCGGPRWVAGGLPAPHACALPARTRGRLSRRRARGAPRCLALCAELRLEDHPRDPDRRGGRLRARPLLGCAPAPGPRRAPPPSPPPAAPACLPGRPAPPLGGSRGHPARRPA